MAFVLQADVRLDVAELVAVATAHEPVEVDDEVRKRVRRSRQMLQQMVDDQRALYGVNTSMGGFVNWLVPVSMAHTMQENLINAVATNVGEYLDDTAVRAMMLARLAVVARGHTGLSEGNMDTLLDVYNAGIVPCVPSKGSLGTSGDLGPLAAIALVCAGQWKARVDDERLPGAQALARSGIAPMTLGFKEGLALINGTSGMVGLGSLVFAQAKQLAEVYLAVSALSVEGLAGKPRPFDPRVHRLKSHAGQRAVAEYLFAALADSGLAVSEQAVGIKLTDEMSDVATASEHHIEDAYSIRGTPHILGPVMDSMDNIGRVLEDELNSCSDNPLIVPEEEEVFHSAHFHGQYVAMAMDHLSIALTTVTNLANRRIDRYLDKSNSNGLPAFLCDRDPGVRLGLMGGQFMTASLTAENRSLTVPLSVQSLTSTADFQDVVSLGLVAARRAREILSNAAYVIAFELLCACQAVDIRGSERMASASRALYDRTRQIVPFLDHDHVITDYLEAIVERILLPAATASPSGG